MDSVPGRDLVLAPGDGSSEGSDLEGAGVVLEIVAEAFDEHFGEVGAGVGVDLVDDFFGVPCGADLTDAAWRRLRANNVWL